MKTKAILLLGSALVCWGAADAVGQFGQPVRAGEVIGSTIKDSQDQKLGTVKDLAVDLENGRIVEVIVARGGFLGVDAKFVGVPPENFAVEAEGKILRLNPSGERLGGAPAVDISKWKDEMDQSHVEAVYRYYGATPYFLVPEHVTRGANNTAVYRLGDVDRASRLIGIETMNREDQKIGKVENLMVDFSGGRVVEVVVNASRYLGLHGELSAMPPQALHFNADRDALVVDTTKEALSSAPHFPSRSWPNIDREQATAVYQAYHVVPYFLPIGIDSSAQNGPSINNKIQPPLQQGSSQADLEITAKIQKAILDADGLSVDARAVKVITVNGRVTLRGMVANPDEKRRVGEIAARVVPVTDVDNQLEIKGTTASAAN